MMLSLSLLHKRLSQRISHIHGAAVIAGALPLFFGAAPLWAHDVKDPVCRMTIDSDTTPYQRTIGAKTFYFCSPKCEAAFDKSSHQYITLADQLAINGGLRYTATLKASHAVPGKPADLAITIRRAGQQQAVHHFEVVHEELMHLILVNSDLSWFEHQHPYLGADGVFRLQWTFPRPGRYYLYADFTPKDGDNQIKQMALDVGNPTETQKTAIPVLTPESKFAKTVDGLHISLQIQPPHIAAGQQALMTYTFQDAQGRPCTDMQTFLGVSGHMFAISADGKEVVHTHTLHGVAPGTYAATMLAAMQAGHALVVTPEMVTEHGPAFTYKVTLPKAGVYKVWTQYMHHNAVVTAPFIVRVAPAP